MFSRLSGCQRCCRTFQTNLSSFSYCYLSDDMDQRKLKLVLWQKKHFPTVPQLTRCTVQYVSFEHNSVHSCFFALSQRQQEEETEDYEEETFCGGLVVEQWTEPPTLKCRHLFVFKFSSSGGKSEFSFPGTFSLKITLVTFCRVHLSIDVSSQFFVSQRPPKIRGNQVERGRAEWKYNIKIKNKTWVRKFNWKILSWAELEKRVYSIFSLSSARILTALDVTHIMRCASFLDK